MRFQPSYGNIWGVTYPLIIAGVSETIIGITDTMFLAHYGTRELAAIGIADSVYGLSLFLIIGLVEATQITIGRRAGQAKPREIGRVFNQGLVLLLLAAAAMIPVLLGLVPALLDWVLATPSLAFTAYDYLRIAAFALVFQALNLVISAFLIGISRTRVLIGASVLLAGTNIALDYLLIFGNAGMPELGISGAAIATLSAEVMAAIYLLLFLARRRYPSRYGLFHRPFWDRALSGRLSRIAFPVSMNALVDMAKWFALLLIIEKLGEVPLAAANIVLAVYSLFLIPVDSFSETVCSMVSNLIGQNDEKRMRQLIDRTIRLCYAVVSPLLVIALLAPAGLVAYFTDNPEISAAAAAGLLAAALAAAIAVPSDTWFSAVLGTGDTRAGFVIQAGAVMAGLAWAGWAGLSAGLGLGLILLSETVTWLVCLAASSGWVRSRRWQRLEV